MQRHKDYAVKTYIKYSQQVTRHVMHAFEKLAYMDGFNSRQGLYQ